LELKSFHCKAEEKMGFLWDSFDKNKAKTGIKLACNRIGWVESLALTLASAKALSPFSLSPPFSFGC
jgi:hypothetical protein